jgi:saccharopine dehydrogenase-like NADP-dependent oxidoreductase
MKILVLGAGNIGSIAAQDLARSVPTAEITIADKDQTRAKTVAERTRRTNITWTQIDTTNHNELINALKNHDLILGFLPGNLGFKLAETCIETQRDLVDVSYMPENPLALNDKAQKNNTTIIPDCGLAPGISNLLVGHATSKLEKILAIHIMVGGLPEHPVPPLGYTITWSPASLLDEYTRVTRIVKANRIAEVETLTGLEEIEFPEIGKLEAFYTDGLRTLIDTIAGVKEMWEKTLRYPGHAEKVQLLKDLGFFDDNQIYFDGIGASPRKLTARLFEQKLWKPEVKDVVALRVEVSGTRGDKHVRFVYHLLDHYDEKNHVTAMARTTAYPASIVAQLILEKAIVEKGVVPPEKLGMNETLFKKIVEELEKRGIKVTEEIKEN